MAKFSSARNFGYGRSINYAGYNALEDQRQCKGISTVHVHAQRWSQFTQWAKGSGIKDARNVTQDIVDAYGQDVKDRVDDGEISKSYGQNLLSSVNVTLNALRGDSQIWISPEKTVGPRHSVRETPPNLSRADTSKAQASLLARGHDRAAAVIGLTREFGLRAKEATLLDISKAIRTAEKTGQINVQEGAKGGRTAPRWVTVTERGWAALTAAKEAANGDKTVIPASKDYIYFRGHLSSVALPALREHADSKLHDMRAAFACERYQEITGHAAPVIAGERHADKAIDREARMVIAFELGHSRAEVLASYIGSAK